jgi:hypothetical protein
MELIIYLDSNWALDTICTLVKTNTPDLGTCGGVKPAKRPSTPVFSCTRSLICVFG